jgi:hypothetical protein
VDQRDFLFLVARFLFFAAGFFRAMAFFWGVLAFFAGLRRLPAVARGLFGDLRRGGAPRTSPPMKEGGSLAGKVSSICSSIALFFFLPGMVLVPELRRNATSYASIPSREFDSSPKDTEFVCIPRRVERCATEDGGPLRYRVVHSAKLWGKGERPVLEQKVVEGDASLSV